MMKLYLSLIYFGTIISATLGGDYRFIDEQLTWEAAESRCQQLYGTSLATITNDDEAKMARIGCRDIHECWVGLYYPDDSQDLEWISGEEYIADNGDYRSVTENGDGSCFKIFGDRNNADFGFYDDPCDLTHGAICDAPPPTVQPTSIPTEVPSPVPTPAPTEEVCDDDTTDYNLLFILDESGSVQLSNYKLTIDFVIDLIEYDVNNIAQLAVLSYSSNNDIVYEFSDQQNDDRQSIIQKLEEEKNDFAGSNTQTYNALLNGLNQFKNITLNSTQNNLLFLFTDGKPTGRAVCASTNYQLLTNLRKFSIRVVIIGITADFDKTEVECIANDNDIYEIDDFTSAEFQSIESELRNILCRDSECNRDDVQFESGAKSHFISINDDNNNLIDSEPSSYIGYYRLGL